jgi:hypothetical protein
LLRLGQGRVIVLFGSFVLIDVSQALIVTNVARFLDRSWFNLFTGFVFVLFLWFYFIHSIMGHRTCRVFAAAGM